MLTTPSLFCAIVTLFCWYLTFIWKGYPWYNFAFKMICFMLGMWGFVLTLLQYGFIINKG